MIKVGIFQAKIYHKEQKQAKQTLVCSNCLAEGHHRTACTNHVVCFTCKKTGHKKGDPACTLSSHEKDSHPDQVPKKSSPDQAPKESCPVQVPKKTCTEQATKESCSDQVPKKSCPDQATKQACPEKAPKTACPDQATNDSKKTNHESKGNEKGEKGDNKGRQPKINSTFSISSQRRSRSHTPKRMRDRNSPELTNKMPRLTGDVGDDGMDDIADVVWDEEEASTGQTTSP
eukprot:TRINITY_DN110908_c0_g1_i12.p1 TRINITY_DN110908_c0_g1~~TRINITY_DN110908_c0_g1_i12.p1  ORF type:complete len:231 (-),score=28.23 TRINITY_DN110908_c0_g1_i12:168-860(-)